LIDEKGRDEERKRIVEVGCGVVKASCMDEEVVVMEQNNRLGRLEVLVLVFLLLVSFVLATYT
jgi:hypothetical protein